MADAFGTLGLPARFRLETAEIEHAFLARSATLHPDIARGDPDFAREMAALNRARQVLRDPEKRADALLLKLGGPAREHERALPPDFLMQMMAVREEVEGAIGAGDPESRAAARTKWEAWGEQRRREAIAEVAALFEGLSDRPDPASLRQIRVRLNAWRYIERLIEQLDPAYDPARADFHGP